MSKLPLGARNSYSRLFAKIQRQWWKVLGLLILLWTFRLYLIEILPISIKTHQIANDDLIFENILASSQKGTSELHANGFLEASEASAYCGAHKWKPFPKRDSRRKIYDLVMVNSELDWLEIRLNELHTHVDYFVVLESATTFTGHPKALSVKDNWERFSDLSSQIIYHVLEDPPASNVSWDQETFQRNAMFSQVLPHLTGEQAPNPEDVILVSDLDEIPRPATLTLLRNCEFPRRLTLRSKFYYYGFQWLHRGEEWAHPQATTYRGPDDTVLPQELRAGTHGINRLKHMDERGDLWNAAWHCSSCFSTVEELLTKMSSFSHVELNTDKFREESAIVDRVRHGKDLWDRFGQWYERVDDNHDVPLYIKENNKKFGYMLDRDGANAGFIDYVP